MTLGPPHDAVPPTLVLATFLPYRLNRISELVSQRFARIYRIDTG